MDASVEPKRSKFTKAADAKLKAKYDAQSNPKRGAPEPPKFDDAPRFPWQKKNRVTGPNANLMELGENVFKKKKRQAAEDSYNYSPTDTLDLMNAPAPKQDKAQPAWKRAKVEGGGETGGQTWNKASVTDYAGASSSTKPDWKSKGKFGKKDFGDKKKGKRFGKEEKEEGDEQRQRAGKKAGNANMMELGKRRTFGPKKGAAAEEGAEPEEGDLIIPKVKTPVPLDKFGDLETQQNQSLQEEIEKFENKKKRKQNFERARDKMEEIQRAKDQAKERREQAEKERQAKLKDIKNYRRKMGQALALRTKKGQPVLGAQVAVLLERIKKQVAED